MAPAKKPKDRNDRTHQKSLQHRGSTSKEASQRPSETDSTSIPIETQQQILDAFRRAFPFPDQHGQPDLRATIQEVKAHLFQRDFSRAFAKSEYLAAYALRWSAGRALGYATIFSHGDLQQIWSAAPAVVSAPLVDPNVTLLSSPASSDSSVLSSGQQPPPSSHASAWRVVCIGGGGGAEVAACAAAAQRHFQHSPPTKMFVEVVDIAGWASCLHQLENALCTPPPLSIYASESATAANNPFVGRDAFQVHFSRRDVLGISEPELKDLMQHTRLCTIMFTLNELFSSSIAQTTAFLLALTQSMSPASWLLVVDSPGSYSEVKLGKGDDPKTRQYPMEWLLDHTLLEVAGADENHKWMKVVSDDSRWFRLNQQSLKYPIELENMRYQIHLYQRVEGEDGNVSVSV